MPSEAKTSKSPSLSWMVAGRRTGNLCPTTPPQPMMRWIREPGCERSRTRIPSTFPIPNHVTLLFRVSREARLITTPRVPFSRSWHRRTSRISVSSGCSSSAATAFLAAAAASGPCPNPSTRPASTPPSKFLTTCRSPDSVSPGRATPAVALSRLVLTSFSILHPLFHGDRGALPFLGDNAEFIHQPARPGEPHAQPSPGRIAVLHRLLDIDDAGAFVAGDNHDARLDAIIESPQDDFTLPCILNDITGHF